MYKVFKYGLIGLLILLILCSAVIGTLIYHPNILKPLIVQWVQTHKQRTLTFNGDIQLSLQPKLKVTLDSLTLSEHNTDSTFLSLQNGHVSLSLKPLLQNKLVVDELILEGLQLSFIRYADGQFNIDDLLTSENNDDSQTDFVLNQLSIHNTALTFDDQKNKQFISLTPLNLTIDQVTPESFKQMILTTDGQIEVLTPSPLKHQLALKFHAENGQFTSNQLSSGKIDLFATLNNPTQQLSSTISLSEITYDQNQYHSEQLAINLDFADKTQTAQISLNTSLNGHLGKKTLILQDLNTQLTYTRTALPDLPILSKLSGHFSVDLSSEQIKTILTGKIQNSDIKAQLSLTDFDQVALGFDVKIDQLDIEQFIPTETKADSTQITQNPQPPEKAIDLSILRTLDANGQIHIGTLRAGDIQSTDILFNIQPGQESAHHHAQ